MKVKIAKNGLDLEGIMVEEAVKHVMAGGILSLKGFKQVQAAVISDDAMRERVAGSAFERAFNYLRKKKKHVCIADIVMKGPARAGGWISYDTHLGEKQAIEDNASALRKCDTRVEIEYRNG